VSLKWDPSPRGLSLPAGFSVVGKSQFVQVDRVWRLFVISVHLIVDGYAPPT